MPRRCRRVCPRRRRRDYGADGNANLDANANAIKRAPYPNAAILYSDSGANAVADADAVECAHSATFNCADCGAGSVTIDCPPRCRQLSDCGADTGANANADASAIERAHLSAVWYSISNQRWCRR